MIGRPKTVYKKGMTVGWWLLERVIHFPPTPGRTGDQWTVRCKCGTRSHVTHEALRTGRSRACDACAKEYRKTYNAQEQLAELGSYILGDAWAELYEKGPRIALETAERRISADRHQLQAFADMSRES